MKTNYLLIFLFFIVTSGYSQSIRQQKMELPDGSKLTYQTINNKLNGIYSIDNGGINFLRGNYVDEKRVGNWYIFKKDKSLFARYNYDQKKLLFLDEKMLSQVSITVKSGSDAIDSNAAVSMPILSLDQYLPMVTKLAESVVPVGDIFKLDPNSVYIVAKVNESGKAEYTVNYILKGKKQEHQFTVDREPFKIEWIPSSYKGKTYPSEFTIKTILTPPSKDGQHRRFNWL